ncbi:MAG: M28 family metallopeptidase [Bacteroidales bacterium]
MLKQCIVILCILICTGSIISAQDTTYVKTLIDELSSETYFGRGYLKNGCNKAAEFLKKEMKNIGLQPYNNDYFQEFSFWVKTFPENITLSIDGQVFMYSYDYIINAESDNIHGTWPLIEIDSINLSDSMAFAALKSENFQDKVVYIHDKYIGNNHLKSEIKEKIKHNHLNAKAYIYIKDHYTNWNVSTCQKQPPVIQFTHTSFPDNPDSVSIHFNSKIRNVEVKNVIGYLPGNTENTFVLTAHYDHLGGIGDTIFFPGANDNASGVAACLDIASYYTTHPHNFNLLIMLFAGEEAGLLGSMYAAANPVVPNEDIDFLINLDMVGTGEKGYTIVNAADTAYHEARELFDRINKDNNYISDLAYRGIAANSDHYPFHAMGVKSVFIYARGGESWYHHVKDTPETVSLSGYTGLFNLLTKFMESYDR